MNSPIQQLLHEDMEATYNRIQISSKSKNCLPEIASFAKQVFNNPILEKGLQSVIKSLSTDLNPLLVLKQPSFEELKRARELISSNAKLIPAISLYIQEWEDLEKKLSPMSWELAFSLEYVITKFCAFLKLDMECRPESKSRELLKHLATLDEKDNIIWSIFAPSLMQAKIEMVILERSKKTSLWYSFHMLHYILCLYDLKNRNDRYLSFIASRQQFAAHFFEDDFRKLDEALYTINNSNQDFDTEEYKIYAHRVWTFIKPILQSNNNSIISDQDLTYCYTDANDLVKGVLKRGKMTYELVGNSAKVLYLALKNKNVSNDEAGEHLPDNQTSKKQQVNNALRVIRNGVLKAFGILKYISTKSGTISVNHPTYLL